MATDSQNETGKSKIVTFGHFLEKIAPNKFVKIHPFVAVQYHSRSYRFRLPEITLFCDGDDCKGWRFFRPDESDLYFPPNENNHHFLTYYCKNCSRTQKVFSIALKFSPDESNALAYKFGEFPTFGPPTPSKLIELIGPDRDYYLLGRNCENQGMGIGAYVYYRRVVENQKNRILDQLIKALKKIGSNEDLIKEIELAKNETQFSKSIESIRHTLPDILLIDSHNPLTLLHGALSEGLHDKSDHECLEIAESIRVVLAELANKMSKALKDEALLKKAISKLGKKT